MTSHVPAVASRLSQPGRATLVPQSQLASAAMCDHCYDYCAWPAGAQIAKLTPFRSYVVTLMTALSLTIMSLLKFKGGTITYAVVSLSAPVTNHHNNSNK